MASDSDTEDHADWRSGLQLFVSTQIRTGFKSRENVLQDAVDYLEDEAPIAEIEAAAAPLVEATWNTVLEEQKSWPTVTDCDRLDRAFQELEAAGTVARQDYWCCQTCGCAAMEDDMKTESLKNRLVTGYVFYHAQDTESAVEGGGLYLAYGSFDGKDENALAIGRQIVLALRNEGLSPTWDGQLKNRICLPLNWQRRLPALSQPVVPRSFASSGLHPAPTKPASGPKKSAWWRRIFG